MMNPKDYVKACLVTEHTPDFVRLVDMYGVPRSAEHNIVVAKLLHAVMGLMTEIGELTDALKKHIIYGKELDLLNFREEMGDLTWYESLALHAVQSSWEEVWQMNIAKLKARYAGAFTEVAALIRDVDAERVAMESIER